jgi:anticodon nuclease
MRSNKNVDINRRDDKITLAGYLLRKNEDETFETTSVRHDSDTSFSYHLFLMQTIDEAIQSNSIRRYHFTLLRNLCEKTANFLGCPRWSKLLPSDSFGESVDKQQRYYSRIINLSSHSKLSNEEISELKDSDKKIVRESLKHIKKKYFHTEEFNTME